MTIARSRGDERADAAGWPWSHSLGPANARFFVNAGRENEEIGTAWRREVYSNRRYRFGTVRRQHQVKLCDIETNCKRCRPAAHFSSAP
jgi:hypothetical protein